VENEVLASSVAMEVHYDCCGKNVCGGCIHSAIHSGNNKKCQFCNSEIIASTDDESFEEMRKRVEANDVDAMVVLANHYNKGIRVLQDQKNAKDLWTQKAAKLGSRDAHYQLGNAYHEGGDLKKSKFHFEAGAWQDTKRYDSTLD
jgi:TPR repeat protein